MAPHTQTMLPAKTWSHSSARLYQNSSSINLTQVLRMQKESVIEREIRLAREREEAYRREKGLNAAPVPRPAQSATHASTIRPTPISTQQDGRDVQHRLATSRIQMEIQETSIKERELRAAGKILTTSEESVDSKVTRMSDFTDNIQLESPRSRPVVASPSASSSSSSSSAASCSSSHPSTFTTPSSTPKRSLSPRSPSSPVPNFTPSPAAARLSRSLSTNNLSNSSISAAPANSRAPKGLMQKFIASRGKMTGSAFASHPPSHAMTTSRGVVTRPMRVEPKAAVVQRETLAKNPHLAETTTTTTAPALHHDPAALAHSKQVYRRSYCTAEEKIQSELKEMQMREEELRRLRARQLAQSQPNLLDVHGGVEHDEQDEEEGQHSLQEVAGLRTAQSIPNLLDDADHTQAADKGVRRRSALIAQWENRIQQTTDT